MRPLVLLKCLAVAGFAYAGVSLADVALPDDVRVVAPPDSVAPDIAAFSGEWRGVWSGKLQSALIVEEINNESATVIYAWGDAPDWRTVKGFQRVRTATVTTKPKAEVRFGGSNTYVLHMNADRKSITITRMSPMPNPRVGVEVFRRVGQ